MVFNQIIPTCDLFPLSNTVNKKKKAIKATKCLNKSLFTNKRCKSQFINEARYPNNNYKYNPDNAKVVSNVSSNILHQPKRKMGQKSQFSNL